MDKKNKHFFNADNFKILGITVLNIAILAGIVLGIIRLFFWNSPLAEKINIACLSCIFIMLQSHPSPHLFGLIKLINEPFVSMNIFILSIITSVGLLVYSMVLNL